MPITAEILIFAWLLQQQPLYNLKQKMMKRFILSLAIRLPVIAGCEKTVAGTTDPEDGPGTFTIEATPSTTSVSLKVTSSDNEKPYLIIVMDNSFYVYNATMEIGNSVVYKGDPAPLYYTSLGSASTLCAIGIDADGNPGEMHMTLTTFPEEGICRPVQFPR